MSRDDVSILIKGRAATGKSCIARAIENTLRRHGLPVVVVDDGGDVPLPDHIRKVFRCWKRRSFASKVVITTKRTRE
jgi:adenylylsulfate kinase-like enzyme